MAILTDDKLDSVEELATVKQAVYVMQSIQHPRVFRFGCLGGRNRTLYSTAVRRLGQCGKYHGETEESWRYVAICELHGRRENTVGQLEDDLRRALLRPNGPFERNGRKDRFSDGDRKQVVEIFSQLFRRQK